MTIKYFFKTASSIIFLSFIFFNFLLSFQINSTQYQKLNTSYFNIYDTKQNIKNALEDDIITYSEYFVIQIRHSRYIKLQSIEKLKNNLNI
jgi:hypothetical protein